jgi:hypothetical protein
MRPSFSIVTRPWELRLSDWLHPGGLTGETVTAMIVKGLVGRDAAGALELTDHGRSVLRATLPDL